ncbi:Ger(x)C family spore germination protein [Anaerobacillus sp. MEB173]|uniref:Ger(x)C family spore germination protein n=1 Tax=Anaerobacillus sp. MEB173 TaxID=3383345 RepID=UPI003F92418C
MTYFNIKLQVLLCILFILSGCVGSEEVNELALVMAVGIDFDKENELVEVTAQIVRPGSAREQTGASTGEPIYTATAEGETIFEAIRNLGRYSSRRVFWAHTVVVVLNEESARKGVNDVIDFFSRNNELRMNTWVVVTSEKASNLVATNTGLEIIPAESLEKLFRYSTRIAEAPKTDMLLLASSFISEDYHPILARVEMKSRGISAENPGEYGATPQVELSGTAVFEDDKMVGWLNPEESRGLLWFVEKIDDAIVPLACPEQPKKSVSLEMRENQFKLTPHFEDGKPKFTGEITTYVDLVELGCITDMTHAELFTQLEKDLEEKLEKEVSQMLDKVQKEYKVDVLRLGRAFDNKYPVEWRRLRDDWKDIFPSVEVDVQAHVQINNPGLLKNPLQPKRD